jgi:hypothetical protein
VRHEAYDPLSTHLASLAKSLGYEVVGPWLYKNAKSLPEWQKHAAKIGSKIWSPDLPPVSMFIMKANLNRRCYEYLFPEASDVWHLQPFANAKDKILKHVRIYWGQGVIDGAVRSRFGQLVADMFNDPRVVYKLQDIEQGNRSNIMAPWWYEDPEDTQKLDYCDFLVGLYSPVYKAFTHGDLRRLMQSLNHDALRMLYDTQVEDNLWQTKNQLQNALDVRAPWDWSTLAILLNNLNFLSILACEVCEDAPANTLNSRTFEICPYFFRHCVTLNLPTYLSQNKAGEYCTPNHGWHPLDDVIQSVHSLVFSENKGLLVVRRISSTEPVPQPSTLGPAIFQLLSMAPVAAQEQEQKIQYICHGRKEQYDHQLQALVELAFREDIQSLTLVRTQPVTSTNPPPKYHAQLARGPDPAPTFEPEESYVPEVIFHVEAYCDRLGRKKPWVNEVAAWLRGAQIIQNQPILREKFCEDRWSATLFLIGERNWSRLRSRVQGLVLNHIQALAAQSVHPDKVVNRIVLEYSAHAIWAHNDLQNPMSLSYQRACTVLKSSDVDPDSLKGLFMNLRGSGGSQPEPLDCLSRAQTSPSPRSVKWTVFKAACQALELTIICEQEPAEIVLPVIPGLAFLVALRSTMYYLGVEDFCAAFSKEAPDCRGHRYALGLRIDQNLVPGLQKALATEKSDRGPGDVTTSIRSFLKCATYGLRATDEAQNQFPYFRGLSKDVIQYNLNNDCLTLSWLASK